MKSNPNPYLTNSISSTPSGPEPALDPKALKPPSKPPAAKPAAAGFFASRPSKSAATKPAAVREQGSLVRL